MLSSAKLHLFTFVTMCLPWTILCSGKYLTNKTFRWVPQGWNGLPLYCPNRCKNVWPTGTSKDGCCACYAKSILDYNHNFRHLNISKDGFLEGNKSAENIALEYSNKHMQVFPKNVCDFPGITRINLSLNLILETPNLSCLPNLTRLDLSWNSLTVLQKFSLTGNRNLRFVNLSHNSISYIETGTLASMAFHVIILRGNFLISVDITDIVFERPFCLIDLSHNTLWMFTNKHKWEMNRNKTYGPGFGDFSHNQFKEMPNVRNLGFRNLSDLGKLFFFGFDVRHNPLICDCRIAEPVLLFKQYIGIMEREYFNITCGSPDTFRGRTIPSIIKKGQITDLICNYTSQAVCPTGCSCINEPDNSSLAKNEMKLILHMNCTGAGLKRLPHILPISKEIEFYLRGNPVEEIEKEHFLERVTVLDLEFIPNFEMEALENLTHLRIFSLPGSQQVHGIPRELSFLDPCIFIRRGNFVMHCTCSDLWMYDWIQTRQTDNCTSYFFNCLNEGGEYLLTMYLRNLDCIESDQHHTYVLLLSGSSAIVFSFILIIFAHIWKFELKVILRSIPMCTRSRKTLEEDCVVYISYDDKIKDLNSWLIKRLEPFLTRNELSTFIPSRDLPLGCIRSEEIAWQISVSRYYIVFLSDDYFDEESLQTLNDWKCIWNSYLSDSRKELLVINYDLMDTIDIQCKTFRAVMRFGNVVDFTSGEKKIFSKISKRFLN